VFIDECAQIFAGASERFHFFEISSQTQAQKAIRHWANDRAGRGKKLQRATLQELAKYKDGLVEKNVLSLLDASLHDQRKPRLKKMLREYLQRQRESLKKLISDIQRERNTKGKKNHANIQKHIHMARIKAKHLRYGIELFPVIKKGHWKKVYKRAKNTQQTLGHFRDLHLLEHALHQPNRLRQRIKQSVGETLRFQESASRDEVDKSLNDISKALKA